MTTSSSFTYLGGNLCDHEINCSGQRIIYITIAEIHHCKLNSFVDLIKRSVYCFLSTLIWFHIRRLRELLCQQIVYDRSTTLQQTKYLHDVKVQPFVVRNLQSRVTEVHKRYICFLHEHWFSVLDSLYDIHSQRYFLVSKSNPDVAKLDRGIMQPDAISLEF